MAKNETETIRANCEPVGSHSLLGATVAYAVLVVAGLVAIGKFPAATETGEQLVACFAKTVKEYGGWCGLGRLPFFLWPS